MLSSFVRLLCRLRLKLRREPQKVTQTVNSSLPECPDCGHTLEKRKVHRNWQTDLPVIEPHVTCFETESGWCPQCNERKRSVCAGQIVTAEGAAAHGLGPKLKVVSATLKHRYGVAYRKQSELFETLLGLKITPSGLCQSSSKLKGVYEEIAELLAQAVNINWLWMSWARILLAYSLQTEQRLMTIKR